ATRQPFAELQPTEQRAALAVGLDAHTWDNLVASRADLLANPTLIQLFAKHARAQRRIDVATVQRELLPALRLGGVISSSGQRALAYLRDFYPHKFTPEARVAITNGFNERRLGSFECHGWYTEVVPQRMPAELKRRPAVLRW
ncbi:MAG TPA: hypothetical protein VFH51_11745, partial [Myxococcota bacterium]|nr:hypothetical protein [Myxococcota bacterium]